MISSALCILSLYCLINLSSIKINFYLTDWNECFPHCLYEDENRSIFQNVALECRTRCRNSVIPSGIHHSQNPLELSQSCVLRGSNQDYNFTLLPNTMKWRVNKAILKNAVICYATPCGSYKDGRFGRTYRLRHSGEKSQWARNVSSNQQLRNVGFQKNHEASHPSILHSHLMKTSNLT
jgi:hypothetical protein